MNKRIDKPLGKPLAAIGQPLRRHEDHRLLTGQDRFTDDFAIEGQAYAAMVRSPHPHARIVGIDAAAARAMPGVLGIFTGADCAADGLKPIPHSPLPSTRTDLKLTAPGGGKVFVGPHHLLAIDTVRHVGEAVAMVVADSLAQALDAAEAVVVDYKTLDWVADAKAACAPGAPAVWDEVPDNVLIYTTFGDVQATRSNALPSFTTEIVEVLSPTNPLGIKAGGEGGTTPALAVVINAIVDALKAYCIRDITMPATPFTVWQAIQAAKARHQS